MATITVRAIDPVTGEPQYGNGTQNFISDLQAVGQIIQTTLLLLQGEWFLNLQAGTPAFQMLLSHSITKQAVALIYQNIILGVPYVTGIAALRVDYIAKVRSYTFAAIVTTVFGSLPIYFLLPMPSASAAASSSLSWGALTPAQWAALTPEQWAGMQP